MRGQRTGLAFLPQRGWPGRKKTVPFSSRAVGDTVSSSDTCPIPTGRRAAIPAPCSVLDKPASLARAYGVARYPSGMQPKRCTYFRSAGVAAVAWIGFRADKGLYEKIDQDSEAIEAQRLLCLSGPSAQCGAGTADQGDPKVSAENLRQSPLAVATFGSKQTRQNQNGRPTRNGRLSWLWIHARGLEFLLQRDQSNKKPPSDQR
jgi:hypothetical protein